LPNSEVPDLSTVGGRIKFAMSQKGLNARALSKIIRKHESTVSQWLSGEKGISPKNLKLIAVAVGKSVDWLLDVGAPADVSETAKVSGAANVAIGEIEALRRRIQSEVVTYWIRKHEGAAPSELQHRERALVEMTTAVFRDRDARQIAELTVRVMLDSMEPPDTGPGSAAAARKPKRA
jgi:transcriptional regulator with XRE-family HTH domain